VKIDTPVMASGFATGGALAVGPALNDGVHSSVQSNTSPHTPSSYSEKVSGRSMAATGLRAVASVGFICPSIESPWSGLPGLPVRSR